MAVKYYTKAQIKEFCKVWKRYDPDFDYNYLNCSDLLDSNDYYTIDGYDEPVTDIWVDGFYPTIASFIELYFTMKGVK